ncbi:PEP/pyruvate-binding domain-containing protein [Nocardiopsis sp. CT-R113]|uniref:PEP/pyruvate-binding domain-containing protein n=1 Tax=Nocardiopsis codii TaxID=3065942 RepID=A0ABU7KBC1_9ACTN|nr:PEP/pyruvate-binding domain-containing protein [Nocardiopsis sp. CT-R113]MEE2039529.1 PEP/pyruvate-binding domain-containing protein [Nocardiopsis sp. CT-R113]
MLVIPLDRIHPDSAALVGGKADGLGEVIRAGERVPPGFCVTTGAHRSGTVPEDEVAAAYTALGGGPVAVRSSATAEDLPDASFAGQQDTYLDVEGVDDLVAAVRRCWDSLRTDRAVAYRRDRGIDDASVHMAVIVQRMVRPRAAGVLFTANPVTGTREETVVDAVRGLGTAVVDGTVRPDHYVVHPDGSTDGPVGGCLSSDEVGALLAAGTRLQSRLGAPQDVEWALDREGTLWILQSRPITTLFPLPARPGDGPRAYVETGNLQGMLRPFTPMGMSGARAAASAWFRDVARAGSGGWDRMMADVGGRFYLDLTPLLRNRVLRGSLPGLMRLYGPRVSASVRALLDDPRFAPRRGGRVDPRAVARTVAAVAPLTRDLLAEAVTALAFPDDTRRRVLRAGPEIRRHITESARDVDTAGERLSYAEEVQTPVMTGSMTPMLGALYVGILSARAPLLLLRGVATAEEVATVLGGMPHNVTTEMDLALWHLAEGARPHRDLLQGTPPAELAQRYRAGELPEIGLGGFLERYGHRGAAEIDVGVPRWAEDPAPLFGAIANYLRVEDPEQAPDRRFARAVAEAERMRDELVRRARESRPVRARLAEFFFGRARALSGLREYPKFALLFAIAEMRRQLLLVGEALVAEGRLDAPDDIMFLDLGEARTAVDGTDLRPLVARRRAVYARERRRRRVPQVLLSDGTDVETTLPALSAGEAGAGELVGVAASAGTATGVARVVHDPVGASLRPGEILVAQTTDPGWTPLFMTAGGVVVETGSTVAHGPTVAREYGIPCVICVPGVTELIRDGQTITIDGGAGTIQLED